MRNAAANDVSTQSKAASHDKGLLGSRLMPIVTTIHVLATMALMSNIPNPDTFTALCFVLVLLSPLAMLVLDARIRLSSKPKI
jgi:hypothetical protein